MPLAELISLLQMFVLKVNVKGKYVLSNLSVYKNFPTTVIQTHIAKASSRSSLGSLNSSCLSWDVTSPKGTHPHF